MKMILSNILKARGFIKKTKYITGIKSKVFVICGEVYIITWCKGMLHYDLVTQETKLTELESGLKYLLYGGLYGR